MSDLPRLVQRAPSLFYGAAIIYLVSSVVLTHLQLPDSYGGGDAGASYIRYAYLSAVLQAVESAVYLAGNGVIAHILLAIWHNGRNQPGAGGGE